MDDVHHELVFESHEQAGKACSQAAGGDDERLLAPLQDPEGLSSRQPPVGRRRSPRLRLGTKLDGLGAPMIPMHAVVDKVAGQNAVEDPSRNQVERLAVLGGRELEVGALGLAHAHVNDVSVVRLSSREMHAGHACGQHLDDGLAEEGLIARVVFILGRQARQVHAVDVELGRQEVEVQHQRSRVGHGGASCEPELVVALGWNGAPCLAAAEVCPGASDGVVEARAVASHNGLAQQTVAPEDEALPPVHGHEVEGVFRPEGRPARALNGHGGLDHHGRLGRGGQDGLEMSQVDVECADAYKSNPKDPVVDPQALLLVFGQLGLVL
ncbi:hypothetical protein G6O67_007930 [Ophiocordyceps sinensis]|uniref:Uncharacterized protein n=1 Tax=Ophiocordyceps sinensis TaxID=72228 RepID=A0A8H4LT86_9HYPO|nr:hypothetical protein G6O67_007930 [Ophiocordyceps sinensis]